MHQTHSSKKGIITAADTSFSHTHVGCVSDVRRIGYHQPHRCCQKRKVESSPDCHFQRIRENQSFSYKLFSKFSVEIETAIFCHVLFQHIILNKGRRMGRKYVVVRQRSRHSLLGWATNSISRSIFSSFHSICETKIGAFKLFLQVDGGWLN